MLRGSVKILVGIVVLSLISGCSNLQKPRRWGTCAVVGSLVGAAAGAGIGIAISENTGDHENNIAAGVGGGAGGAILTIIAGLVKNMMASQQAR